MSAWALARRSSGLLRITARLLANGVTTPIIPTRARLTATTDRNGFMAACSSASDPGMAGAGGMDGADTVTVADMATAAATAFVDTDAARMRVVEHTAGVVDTRAEPEPTVAEFALELRSRGVDLAVERAVVSVAVAMSAEAVAMPAVVAATAVVDTGKTGGERI